MIGRVIVGDASAATEKADTIRLWYMRLGYVSERGIQALYNKRVLQVSNIAN